jgi:hypothetical protein
MIAVESSSNDASQTISRIAIARRSSLSSDCIGGWLAAAIWIVLSACLRYIDRTA